MPAGMHGLRSGAGGSLPPRGRLGFFTCVAWLFLALGRLWRWVVDGSCFRLPCCQVQGEGGSETYAYGYNRPSRAKTEREHVVSPPKRATEFSECAWLYPGHGPKVDRLQKEPSHSQVWSMDGFGWYAWTWRLEKLHLGMPEFATRPKGSGFYREEAAPGAWTYGPYLTRANVKKLLGLLAVQGSKSEQRANLWLMKVGSRNGSYMFERKHQGFLHGEFLTAWLPITVVFLPFALCSMYFFGGGLGGSSARLFEDFKFKGCCSDWPLLKTMPWEFRKNPCGEKNTNQPSDDTYIYVWIYVREYYSPLWIVWTKAINT